MNSIVTPGELISYFELKKRFPDFVCPELCLLFFDNDYLNAGIELFTEVKKGPMGFFTGKFEGLSAGLIKCIQGPCSASINLEILSAMGFRKFIASGSAGALCKKPPSFRVGDLVIGKAAFRDEGLFQHYPYGGDSLIENESNLISRFQNSTEATAEVISWTTDAPFMETQEKFERFLKLGASIVEMEMASLLAVAKARSVEMLNLFVISDMLYRDRWEPGFKSKAYLRGQNQLFEALVNFFRQG